MEMSPQSGTSGSNVESDLKRYPIIQGYIWSQGKPHILVQGSRRLTRLSALSSNKKKTCSCSFNNEWKLYSVDSSQGIGAHLSGSLPFVSKSCHFGLNLSLFVVNGVIFYRVSLWQDNSSLLCKPRRNAEVVFGCFAHSLAYVHSSFGFSNGVDKFSHPQFVMICAHWLC